MKQSVLILAFAVSATICTAAERTMPNTIVDFGFTKGFINRNALNCTRSARSAQLNLVLNSFFWAPGNRLEDKEEVYPQLSLDPDVAFGASVGVGPQINMGDFVFAGFDLSLGGGLYGAQYWRLTSSNGLFQFKETYYEWGPSLIGLGNAFLGFAPGKRTGKRFIARVGGTVVVVTGVEHVSVSFPIHVSFGFGV